MEAEMNVESNNEQSAAQVTGQSLLENVKLEDIKFKDDDSGSKEQGNGPTAFSMGTTTDPQKKKTGKKNKRNRMKKGAKGWLKYDDTSTQKIGRIVNLDLFLEERRDVTEDAARRTDTLHLYGIDLMGRRDIFLYLKKYNPANIEWINDSSCNVMLESEDDVERAIQELGHPIPPDDMPEELLQDTQFCLRNLWYRAEPFVKRSQKLHLMIRMATEDDRRDETKEKVSRNLWRMPVNKATRRLRNDANQEVYVPEPQKVHKEGNKRKWKAPMDKPTRNQNRNKRRKNARQNKRAKEEQQEKDDDMGVEQTGMETKEVNDQADDRMADDSMSVPQPPNPTDATPAEDAQPDQFASDLRDFIHKLRQDNGVGDAETTTGGSDRMFAFGKL